MSDFTFFMIFGGGIVLLAAIALYAQRRDFCNKMADLKRKYSNKN